MLSMSTTMWSAWVSGSSCQRPERRSLASRKAALSAASVAGSIPASPKVRAMLELRTGRYRECKPAPRDRAGPPGSAAADRLLAPAARQVRLQERHLVGEAVAVRQDQVLDPARPVRHRQQRHRGLLRGPPALAGIAVEAGADHVLPHVARSEE